MKNSKWDDILKGIFSKKNTFLASAELIEILCKEHNIQRDNARTIIKRAADKKIIKNSSPFTFIKGQYVYMGPDDSLDLSTLIKISKKYKPSMYRVLSLLNKNNRIVSLYEARKAAAVPIENLDRYKLIQIDEEIKKLVAENILFITPDPEREILYLASNEYKDAPQLNALKKAHFEKMRLDSLFLPDIMYWLKEHNFISNNNIVYRRIDNPSIGAKHNDFLWDAYAYTNTTGFSINVGKEDKQTLVVLDVLIHREYSKEDLDGFYNRIQSVRNSTHGDARKILPIIFFVEAEPSVKREMKKLKILNFSLQNIFGTKIKELINQLDNINTTLNSLISVSSKTNNEEASVEIVRSVENSLNNMEKTGHINNLQNLQGDLFESLMYVVILNLFPSAKRISHSKVLKPYEYDILIEEDQELIVIELKGFKNKTIIQLGDNKTKNTVKWFFGKTFPHAKTTLASSNPLWGYQKSQIKACYITSANFSDEATEFLEKQNSTKLKPEKFSCFYNQKSLLNLIRTHENLEIMRNSTNFVFLLERYYLKTKNE